MKVKPKWEELDKDKWVVKTDKGYTLVIVLELRKLIGKTKAEFPENYQLKIHAYNLSNPDNEFVRIDNHNNRPPHYHYDKQEVYFKWVSWNETKELFYSLTIKRFGNFPWE